MTRRPSAIEKLPPGPFLGRRIELARLCRAVEQTRHGRGAHYWLVGPAGIGKSRLLVEIAHYAGMTISRPAQSSSPAARTTFRRAPT